MGNGFIGLCLALLLCFSPVGVVSAGDDGFDGKRNRVIAHLLASQLKNQHYSRRPLDDELSQRAFSLYLKQLDPRKRFLFSSDVDSLEQKFSKKVDDEINEGRISLPDTASKLFVKRVLQVKGLLPDIFKGGFDFKREEFLETDPEKVKYVNDKSELRERWRLLLKMQIIDEYLSRYDENLKDAAKEKKNLSEKEETRLWREATQKIKERNERYLGRLISTPRQDYYDRYFISVAQAYDPHTIYMPPDSKEDFDIHMSGELEGIGALLREEDGYIKVVRIIPGSASERQGELAAEDIILSVSEKGGEPFDLTERRIRDAVRHIRGPKGTEVILTVEKPDGSKRVIPIIRDVVLIEETYVKSTVVQSEGGVKVGYLKIPSFYRDFKAPVIGDRSRNVTDDTRSALFSLKSQGVEAVILDLRDDGGGSLPDAVKTSGLFLSGGPVVQVKDYDGQVHLLDDTDSNVAYAGPLVVLVNQFSASASEIMAAVLQDYDRALIVGGLHTHGKGTVQALMDLNKRLPLFNFKKYGDLGALKITIQKFYRVNGGSVQYKGVEPDIVAPSLLDALKTGERYIDYSLPWDTISPAIFKRWQGVKFDENMLRGRAASWVATNEKFNKIKKDLQELKKKQDDSVVNVSLSAMKKERQDADRRKEEAIEAGFIEKDPEEAEKEKKPLLEKISADPFVNLALFIIDSSSFTQKDLPSK